MAKKWLLIVFILLTIVNLAAIGTFMCGRFCHKKGGFASGGGEHFRRMKKQFHLTDEQVAGMKSFREKFNPRIETLSQTLKERRCALVEELMKEFPDSAYVEDILLQIDSSQSLLQRETVNHLLAQKEILNPEQRERFLKINQNKRRKNHE